MKSFVARYRTIEKLDDFLQSNSIVDSSKLLIQIFSTISEVEDLKILLDFLNRKFKNATIVGASSSAQIFDAKTLKDDTTINFTIFERSFVLASSQSRSDNSFDDGKLLAKKIHQENSKAIILYSTMKDINMQRFLKGIESNIDEAVICGAVGANIDKEFDSYIIYKDKIIKDGFVAVSLAGENLSAFNLYKENQSAISREFSVSRCEGNRLISLDSNSASKVYLHYLQKSNIQKIPYYSLEFPFMTKRKGVFLSLQVTDVLSDGTLLFGTNIKKDEKLRLSFFDLESAKKDVHLICDDLDGKKVETFFVYSSISRELFMKDISRQEIKIVGKFAPVVGFYGVGEYFCDRDTSLFMSHTFTLLALSESDKKIRCKRSDLKRYDSKYNSSYETIKTLTHIARLSSNELEVLNKKLTYKINEGVRDIRKKESLMIHNNRLAQLGEMLGLIAHQWRQPLSAISATATGMEVKIELGNWDEKYIMESLQNIEKYVSHLSETIDDFTNFFKPTKKKVKTSLKQIIEKSLFISSSLLAKENVEVIKKIGDEKEILTYPNEVTQVLLNLIKNSVNALVSRGVPQKEIYIQSYQDDFESVIEIGDNAGGIDEKYLEKIFEPYFSTKNSSDSMGLGLYMSKFIIEESCGGKLLVENTKVGAKFKIVL